MCEYKPSLTKIETSYVLVLLNSTNTENVDTILLFLFSSCGQFFVSDPKKAHDFRYRNLTLNKIFKIRLILNNLACCCNV